MKKKIQIIVLICMFLISTSCVGISTGNDPIKNKSGAMLSYFPESYDFGDMQKSQVNSITIVNITVDKTWDLLNDISNGIQIPIDVRYDPEWVAAHIDTPYPENPKHHCTCAWEDPTVLQDFMDLYQGKEIILYCNDGSRSIDAASTLVTHNFNGVIYNMVGGINAWIQAGYPTKADAPPSMPVISGESNEKFGKEYPYTFTATDDEDTIYYYINWSDSTTIQLVGPYHSGEAVILNHIWSEKGTYTIKAQSRDAYFLKSDWGSLEVTMPKTGNTIFYQLLLRLFEKIHLFFLF